VSGIVGILHFDREPIDEAILQKMRTSITHRGPDQQGIWSSGSVGFGHVALHTTLESEREHQPCSLDGQVWITADARIDARDELKHLLESKGRPESRHTTDVELILHAYYVWGEACVQYLIGDFAFVIWDSREQKLFCARDHFGAKPFCYFANEHVFIFASEPKAILQHPRVPHLVNEARIADYLVNSLGLEDIDFTSTFFQNIVRLPPAHSLTILPNHQIAIKKYGSLDAIREITYSSPEEYDAAFLELFEKSIQDRMRNHAVVGAMLSGGMDSSAIVGVARQLFSKNGYGLLPTFSAISDSGAADWETYYSGLVIRGGGLQPYTVSPGQVVDYIEEMRASLFQVDDLFAQWLDIPHLSYIMAQRQGIRAVFDGVDGDIIASHGRWYISYLLQEREWRKAFREARGSARFYAQFHQSIWKILYQQGRPLFIPLAARQIWRGIRERLFYTAQNLLQDSVINPEFARNIGLLERKKRYDQREITPINYSLRERAAFVLEHPMITVALERYDRVAASHSIEALHPFMDKRLAEFCLALPWDQKIREGWTKLILRRATKGLLPEEVRWRPGWEHLGHTFMQARFIHDKDLMYSLLYSHSPLLEPYVNIKRVKDVYERFLKTQNMADGDIVWTVVSLIAWLKNYIVS
jgi:asparagine synthase (glutamine-hydrolysing)